MPAFTLIVAPFIPSAERQALEAHWRDSVLDPEKFTVINYEADIHKVEIPDGHIFLVSAPEIPASEVDVLYKTFRTALDAERPEDRIVVCNYEVYVSVVAPDGTVTHLPWWAPNDWGEVFE